MDNNLNIKLMTEYDKTSPKEFDMSNLKASLKPVTNGLIFGSGYRRRYRSPDERFFHKIKIGFLVGLAALGVFFGAEFTTIGTAPVPSQTQVKENLCTLGVCNSKIASKTQDGQFARYFTRGGEIKVGISDDFTEEEVNAIKQDLNTYNYIFSHINSKYRFVVDDHTSALENMSSGYIKVKPAGDLGENVLAQEQSGTMPTANGYKTTHNTIYMGAKSRERIDVFRHTFLHEFMHALGVDDAYTKDNFGYATIMNAVDYRGTRNDLYAYDVALLAALYGDLSTPEKVEEMREFISHYSGASQIMNTSQYNKAQQTNGAKTTGQTKTATTESEEAVTMQ